VVRGVGWELELVREGLVEGWRPTGESEGASVCSRAEQAPVIVC
jgi:hypothetical protein